MSANVHVLPLLPSVMSMLNVRKFVGLIAADANLIILETENLQRFVECRESRFKRCFKSKRCYFALRIQFAWG